MLEYRIDASRSTLFSAAMKVRDSGMPEVAYWETLFDVPLILGRMGIDSSIESAVEVGSGYGTFTIPAARLIRGTMYTYDIEPDMIRLTEERSLQEGLRNVKASVRDVIASGADAGEPVDYVLLFNILHHDAPLDILREALHMLRPGGTVGCMHWNYDPATPRGPAMEIRPRPSQIREWMTAAGFEVRGGQIDLPPHHYGWLGTK